MSGNPNTTTPNRLLAYGRPVLTLALALMLAACSEIAAYPATPAATPVAPDAPIETPASNPLATATPQPTPAPTFQAMRLPLTTSELAERIDHLLAGRTGRYSIVVELPGGAVQFRSRSGVQIEAASLYKLAIMVELYQQREVGTLSFNESLTLLPAYFLEDTGESFTIGDRESIAFLLDRMITQSSNVAAAALLARVGNSNVNATMARLGLASTEVRWMPGGTASGLTTPPPSPTGDEPIYNVTSAADMGRLFTALLAGTVVSPKASAEMLTLLAGQQINDRLPALLPTSAVVAHKTGNLPGLVHDVGVIYTPNGPAVVAVLTEGVDDHQAAEFITLLGVLVYYAVP